MVRIVGMANTADETDANNVPNDHNVLNDSNLQREQTIPEVI
jgi:hypothetical protein